MCREVDLLHMNEYFRLALSIDFHFKSRNGKLIFILFNLSFIINHVLLHTMMSCGPIFSCASVQAFFALNKK